MSYGLIITEKPKASQKIAVALADGKAIAEKKKGVAYYKITHGKKDYIVACAVGHLYGIAQKMGKKWEYPIFDVEWKPTFETSKSSAFTKKYLEVISQLAKKADEFIVATDYDIEGEVIGLNCVRYACKQKDAKRMKFSTLTPTDVQKAFEDMSSTLDWGQGLAGETRHILDWFYGINMSRALTDSIKAAGSFKIMSIGRVQGPALKLMVDKEKEISAFIPVPFWQIPLDGKFKSNNIYALHEKDKFWDKKDADKVMKKVKGLKSAPIKEIDRKKFSQAPPMPFDLTSLQIEAYRTLKIPPKQTLSLAQELYLSGLISYPRTSSQQLPPEIGFKKIITALSKKYSKECKILLAKKSLKPNNGKKKDPAHPAIYPTGHLAKSLEGRTSSLYDLICRRFFATFGDPATRETTKAFIDCKSELFIAKGIVTTEKGWHELYGKFATFKEEELPLMKVGDIIDIKKIECLSKETSPPKRYTESSIIKELANRGLGTKATRAHIIDTLEQRNYIDGRPLTATEFGIKTCETLEKYLPEVLDEELTRHFEMDMEKIRSKKKESDKVLSEAKRLLSASIKKFSDQKKKIGEELKVSIFEAKTKAAHVGKCKKCSEGDLQIRRGKFGQFIACSGYPDCKTTFSLPGKNVKPTGKDCEECAYPTIMVLAGKRTQKVCINPDCPTKKMTKEEKEEAKKIKETPCPKCDRGKMILRSSVYGKFMGCDQYPKCRTIMPLHEKKVEKKD